MAVRAQGEGAGPAAELVLVRSRAVGAPVRLASNRTYLARAVALGPAEWSIAGADRPVVARAGRRTYAWQPLAPEAALGPADDAVRIPSATEDDRARPRPHARRATKQHDDHDRHADAARPGPAHAAASAPQAAGLAALIEEAAAVHAAAAELRARTARLVSGLRRHRRQSRLMQSTLAALRQLKLQEVAG